MIVAPRLIPGGHRIVDRAGRSDTERGRHRRAAAAGSARRRATPTSRLPSASRWRDVPSPYPSAPADCSATPTGSCIGNQPTSRVAEQLGRDLDPAGPPPPAALASVKPPSSSNQVGHGSLEEPEPDADAVAVGDFEDIEVPLAPIVVDRIRAGLQPGPVESEPEIGDAELGEQREVLAEPGVELVALARRAVAALVESECGLHRERRTEACAHPPKGSRVQSSPVSLRRHARGNPGELDHVDRPGEATQLQRWVLVGDDALGEPFDLHRRAAARRTGPAASHSRAAMLTAEPM